MVATRLGKISDSIMLISKSKATLGKKAYYENKGRTDLLTSTSFYEEACGVVYAYIRGLKGEGWG